MKWQMKKQKQTGKKDWLIMEFMLLFTAILMAFDEYIPCISMLIIFTLMSGYNVWIKK